MPWKRILEFGQFRSPVRLSGFRPVAGRRVPVLPVSRIRVPDRLLCRTQRDVADAPSRKIVQDVFEVFPRKSTSVRRATSHQRLPRTVPWWLQLLQVDQLPGLHRGSPLWMVLGIKVNKLNICLCRVHPIHFNSIKLQSTHSPFWQGSYEKSWYSKIFVAEPASPAFWCRFLWPWAEIQNSVPNIFCLSPQLFSIIIYWLLSFSF